MAGRFYYCDEWQKRYDKVVEIAAKFLNNEISEDVFYATQKENCTETPDIYCVDNYDSYGYSDYKGNNIENLVKSLNKEFSLNKKVYFYF